jgi:signal transduction histidine kinase/ActR/RegA family two-component response regulator/HAMP domain-containing protein
MALRRHLVILAALTLLPLLVFTTWTVLEMHREERARVERSLTVTARALSLAVDGDLTATVTALEGLATSSNLDTGDLRAFHAQASAFRTQRPGWTTIALEDPHGTEILNVLRPLGTSLALSGRDPEDIRRVVTTARPVIGDAFVGPLSRQWVIGVHVPVIRNGVVRYVLSTTIHTHELRDILLDQRLAPEWIGTILDRKRVIVARTQGEEKFVGQPASDRLLAASAQASEGWYRGLTKEGTETYSAFSRSPRTGMTVALGVPAPLIEAPLSRSLWRLAGSGALALALGIAVAVFFARRIAGPISTLAVAAHDIGRGTAPQPAPSAITEVNALRDAMSEAARLVRAERDTLETISRTGQMLSGELSLERLVQGVTDACTRICRAAFGAFFYAGSGERGAAYSLSAIAGVPREAFASFPAARPELFGATFRGEPVVRLDDVTTDTRDGTDSRPRRSPPGHPFRSYLAVSVVSRSGEVLGGLFFGHPEPGVFTEREEALVRGLAPHIATAIDNARLYERQQAARAEAEAANTLKDEFLATLSHELRTPLNAVLGWARMLKTSSLDEATARRAVDVIERNAHAQMQLIEDLLDVSRIIAGKLRLDVRAVSPAAVIEAAIDALRPAAEAKSIRLQPVLDPRAGPVSGDPDRLQQVVWNLLSNAVKFTPRGGRVQVRLARVNSHVEIVVTDTGKGIAADILPFVFDRFRQADSSSQRAHGGLGIGLALVKNLVELHGGSVQAASDGPDRGATFTVKLPLMLHAETVERGPAAPGVTSTGLLSGISLMVLDDDTDALDLFATVLRQAGCEVRSARSVAEALSLLRAWEPDVVVSDIEMPEENGYAFIRQLRGGAVPHGDRIPAIAVTAYGGVNERIRILSAGFDAYVAKPVEPDELAAIIGRMVARARAGRRVPGE